MKKVLGYLRNKYILVTSIFIVYILLLDDHDIFTLIRNQGKLNEIVSSQNRINKEYKEVQTTLDRLDDPKEVAIFAREHKYFKKDDEDIFVIFEVE